LTEIFKFLRGLEFGLPLFPEFLLEKLLGGELPLIGLLVPLLLLLLFWVDVDNKSSLFIEFFFKSSKSYPDI